MKTKFALLFLISLVLGISSCTHDEISESETEMDIFADGDPPSEVAEEDIEPNN